MKKTELKKLMEEMSLEEKAAQLFQLTGGFFEEGGAVTGPEADLGITQEEIQMAGSVVLSGLGAEKLRKIQEEHLKKNKKKIPLLFMADIINGYRTVFPIPIAQACTFHPQLTQKGAEIAAAEAAASGVHVTFSPMSDLVRDPRWGRVMEAWGEDPLLNASFSRSAVLGYQGTDISRKGKIASCVKHFAGYGAPCGGREYNHVELSERTLREDYLDGYKAAIKAGVKMVMTSFNTLERIPSTGNRKLMRDILRKELGFHGNLISDYSAVHELVPHGVAANDKEAAALAMKAGVDIDMGSRCYVKFLKELVLEGEIEEELLNDAVWRVLSLKNELGLFDNPMKDLSEEDEKRLLLCKEHRECARKCAEEAMVLLKNQDRILPIKKTENVAYIGPFLDEKGMLGNWSVFADREDTVTVREGLKHRGMEGEFAAGTLLFGNTDTEEMRKEAVKKAANADKVVLLLGEHESESGEGGSHGKLRLPKEQRELLDAVVKVNPQIILVIFAGRPLVLTEEVKKAKGILMAWYPGTEAGDALADILSGSVNPSGKLSMSFPVHEGQIPVYYNAFSTGRPKPVNGKHDRFYSQYLDIPNDPLFPFGYGLSYTKFSYTDIRLDKKILKGTEDILHASVAVKNVGTRRGKEIVQMYIRDLTGSVVRPMKELKGFRKIELEPGQEENVVFEVREDMLRFWDIDMKYKSEPGKFEIWIGENSTTENKAEFSFIDP